MLINLFLKNKLDYKDVEIYTNYNLTIVSMITCLTIYFDSHYNLTSFILKYYLLLETLFLPKEKISMIIHHIAGFLAIHYLSVYNMDVDNDEYKFIPRVLFITEASSIFLGIMSIIKDHNYSFILKDVVNTFLYSAFLISFIKYRIVDFHYYLIEPKLFDTSIENREIWSFQKFYAYSTMFTIYGLNLYWFCIIVKMISKKLRHYFSYELCEYLLQYSYFACVGSTIWSYSIYATSYEKEHNGWLFLIDVISNLHLSITSYKFHKYLYSQDLNTLNLFNNDYLYILLKDILAIHLRSLTQVYVNLQNRNLFEYYGYVFYYEMINMVIVLSIISSIIFYNKINGRQILYNDKNHVVNKTLDMLFGCNPFFCILLSTINTSFTNSVNTYTCLYILFLIVAIKPFYEMNHLVVHIAMTMMNYLLVMNNLNTTCESNIIN